MKSILVVFLILLMASPLLADDVPLNEVITLDANTFSPTTGQPSAADTTPSCKLLEETTDAAIITGSMTLRTSTTGEYRMQMTLSAANGVEVGKWYIPKCIAVVGGVTGIKQFDHFRAGPAENTAGYNLVDVGRINNVSTSSVTTVNANQGTTQPHNFTGTGASALVKTDVTDIAAAAVNTSSAQLGVNVVNAAGTAWNSGAIGASTLATDTITAAKIAADSIGASEIAADAIGASEIATDAIGAAEIAAGAITSTEATSVGSVAAGTAAFWGTGFSVAASTAYAGATAGSFGKEVADNAGGSALTTGSIADAVWDEATSGHTTAGTTGKALTDAASAGDPWSTALPGAYAAGEAGYIVGNQVVKTSTVNRPLDVDASGNAGIDWSNISNPTSTVNLSGTTVKTATDIATSITTLQATVDLLQVLPKGVAFTGYPIFMRQRNTAATGVTSATVSCTRAVNNGAGFGSFVSTGLSSITEVGNGYYSVDMDTSVIGNATILRCTASGGSAQADPFLREIFGQR